MARGMTMQPTAIPAWSIFVGHGFAQHDVAAYSDCHAIRYHIYFVADRYELGDDVSPAYNRSIPRKGEEGETLILSRGKRIFDKRPVDGWGRFGRRIY